MKKYFFGVLFLFFQICVSQPFQNWKGYFSYNQIKDLSESSTKVYAAAENALFTKNLSSNDIKTINTIIIFIFILKKILKKIKRQATIFFEIYMENVINQFQLPSCAYQSTFAYL